MKPCITLVTSVALALAAPAFAQDSTPQGASQQADDQQAASDAASDASSDASSNPSDAVNDNNAMPTTGSRRAHHRHGSKTANTNNPSYDANTARMNGDEPGVAAYQRSDRVKSYPRVDHGHVAGDPPVIDHSDDQTSVANPTQTTITVPPSQQSTPPTQQ